MELLKNKEITVESDDRSAIYSHQSNCSPDVHAVCHHSGKYLTVTETNPTTRLILREQHDFPGLPILDDSFKKAAHAAQHEHWVWSLPGIQGTVFLLSGLLVLYLVYQVEKLSAYMMGGIWLGLYSLIITAAGLTGIILVGYGIYLILQRDTIFHKRAHGMPPATTHFPVQCTYKIEIVEKIEAELGNVSKYPNSINQYIGRITTTLNPLQNELETLAKYQKQYQNHAVGDWVTAGAIAMSGTPGINFLDRNIDFDHRLVLCVPSETLEMDTQKGAYKPFEVISNYTVTPEKVCSQVNGLTIFPLQCEPRLSPIESQSLELHFTWLGKEPQFGLFLEECILGQDEKIPEQLLPVTKVFYGRYDSTPEAEKVIWRNLPFQKIDGKYRLLLKVQFEEPPLNCLENIVGKYQIRINDLVSQLEINKDNIWTAWGLKAEAEDSLIRRHTIVNGQLIINPQCLAQEHEHVAEAPPIICELPPNQKTVSSIMTFLLDRGFDLHSINQAPPRLHPTGRLDAQLQYWDISGRHYDSETLEAIDLHVIISGYDHISRISSRKSIKSRTQIDIHLRCLHDPRHRYTAERADTLLFGLTQFIQNELGQCKPSE